jgi:hypothetical protein
MSNYTMWNLSGFTTFFHEFIDWWEMHNWSNLHKDDFEHKNGWCFVNPNTWLAIFYILPMREYL